MIEDLKEQVTMERVEMIARLATEGACRERDREIALALIAEMARGNLISDSSYAVAFAVIPAKN